MVLKSHWGPPVSVMPNVQPQQRLFKSLRGRGGGKSHSTLHSFNFGIDFMQ